MDLLTFLLAVVISSASINGCCSTDASTVHYVAAETSGCYNFSVANNKSCNTLDGYVANASECFNTSNTDFLFLGGNHTMNGNVTFKNLHDIKLQRSAKSNQVVFIECSQEGVGFKFDRILNLTIAGLTFHGCSRVYYDVMNDIPLLAALFILHVTDLTMHQVTVQHTKGIGTFIQSMDGDSKIADCTFQNSVGDAKWIGCNAVFYFGECESDYTDFANAPSTVVKIDRTNFLYGNDSYFYLASGLVILLKCPNVEITITNANITGNEANYTYFHVLIFHTGVEGT